MTTLPGILKCIGTADNGPADLPDVVVREVMVEPPQEESAYLYVSLPDQPISAERTDQVLACGTVALGRGN